MSARVIDAFPAHWEREVAPKPLAMSQTIACISVEMAFHI